MSLREELLAIAAAHDGVLQAEHVVEAASDPASPLHDRFVWDDTEAARQWRLAQAQSLIRRCKITVEKPDGSAIQTRAFISITEERGPDRPYRDVVQVIDSDAWRASMLRAALRELRAFRRKYAALSELAELLAQIDEVAQSAE